MTPSIKIIRYPYEEPHHLNLVMEATKGHIQGRLEFYCNASDLIELANELEAFPRYSSAVYLWELGSERGEDRFAHYFRLRLFTTDSVDHCAIQLRFNNNEDLPDREVAEFCIEADHSELNHFGKLVRKFSKLEHEVLYWERSGGQIYKKNKEAEQKH
ncbi:hypothetical protein [Desulfoluna butyratoxydans]|uniref:hypothetical protein n=1 Tax=Desulfoluna butyratoxydans TaxID=231438 RepID=UPI001C552C6A|nr:hypothetical protein [Desulfoluna butyratoxydans]